MTNPITKSQAPIYKIRRNLAPVGSYSPLSIVPVEDAQRELEIAWHDDIVYESGQRGLWKECVHESDRAYHQTAPTQTNHGVKIILHEDPTGKRPLEDKVEVIPTPVTESSVFINPRHLVDMPDPPLDYDNEYWRHTIAENLVGFANVDDPSVLTALVEMRDIPKTLRSMKDLMKWVEKSKGKSFSDTLTLGGVANAYLAETFGVEPTVSDVRSLFNKAMVKQQPTVNLSKGQTVAVTQATGSQTLEQFKESCGRLSQTREITTATLCATQVYWEHGPVGSRWAEVGPISLANSLNSQEVITSGVLNPHYREKFKERSLTIKAFGRVLKDMSFTRPAPLLRGADPFSTAWEVIPFSFVVDWFANLGDWLDQENKMTSSRNQGFFLQNDGYQSGIWFGEKERIVEYWPKVTAHVDYIGLGDTRFIQPQGVWVGEFYFRPRVKISISLDWEPILTRTRYRRYRWGDVPRFAALQTKFPTRPYQWATGAALAVQQARRLRGT